MEQAGLTDNWDGNSGGSSANARPAAEAFAVAGDKQTHVSEVIEAEEFRFPDADRLVELLVTQVDYSFEGGGSTE